MARLFDDGASEYLTGALSISEPFALACWAYYDDLTNSQGSMSVGSDANHWHKLGYEKWTPSVGFNSYEWADHEASTTANVNINTWHHIVGIAIAADSRAVFLDGGNKGTDAVAAAITPDTVVIGARVGPGEYMSGRVAEAAAWDLSDWPGATDADKVAYFETHAVPALAAGYSPLFFPLGLVFYAPLVRDEDRDIVGGLALTPVNAPSVAAHPRIIYPARQILIPPSVSVLTIDDTTWGHDTAVAETNVRDFSGNWTGTGTIEGAGDAEVLRLDAGENMVSEVVNTGAVNVELLQNSYDPSGDDVTLEFRQGATEANCLAAVFGAYSVPFLSDGFVQIRVTSTQ